VFGGKKSNAARVVTGSQPNDGKYAGIHRTAFINLVLTFRRKNAIFIKQGSGKK